MNNSNNIPVKTSKIAIRTHTGIQVIYPQHIIYCKADGRYTRIFLKNGESILVSRLIKRFEEILPEEDFFRVHKSYLVNINYISEFKNPQNKILILLNNTEFNIAVRRKSKFISFFTKKMVLV